jgi:hypothetical protein
MRNVAQEVKWLEHAELEFNTTSFSEHALRRLDAGAADYGDRWVTTSIEKLISELAEEAADLGGWGVLALQALARSDLGGQERDEIATNVLAAIAFGARAHREMTSARRLVELSRSRQRPYFTPDVDGRCVHCERTYARHPDGECPRSVSGTGSSS